MNSVTLTEATTGIRIQEIQDLEYPKFIRVTTDWAKTISENEFSEKYFSEVVHIVSGNYEEWVEENEVRVLDIHQLMVEIFKPSSCEKTAGEPEIVAASKESFFAQTATQYRDLANSNQSLLSRIDLKQKEVFPKFLEMENLCPEGNWELFSDRDISLIANFWKENDSLWQRIIEIVRVVVRVFYQYPAAFNIWSNRAKDCEDPSLAKKYHYFAQGYRKFPSAKEQFLWIREASENQSDVNWNMQKVLQEMLDGKELKEEIFQVFTGRDRVTYEEMVAIREWVAANVGPMNQAMKDLHEFYDTATYFALGLVPTTGEAPLDDFKEKASAVYDACKTFEREFSEAFPQA